MKKLVTISGLVILAIVIIFLIGFYNFNRQSVVSIGGSSNIEKIFEVKEGAGAKMIGEELEQAGLVKNKNYFFYYIWKNDLAGKLQAGEYELRPNMTIPEIVEIISAGKIKPQITKLTIPEGFTNKKIVERLKTVKPEFSEEFEKIASCKCLNEPDCECDVFSGQVDFLQGIPPGVDMEGYLFPDTYFIEKDDTAKILAEKFLNNFKKQVDSDLINDIQSQSKSLHEIMTMASIIEREVKTDDDRKLVSGLFWQRIADEHPLQSCATLAYFLEIDKPQFSYEDTRIESPYNTYVNPGLPPGPIANPGINSIKAAAYPEESDYYYFLSDPETGEIIYSKTVDEHNANKLKYGL